MSQTDGPTPIPERLKSLVERSQKVMAHGWMIRTFIKHCDEVDDFPELNEMARTIFDAFRAVETQVEDPAEYFRTVRKKLAKLQSAAEQFAKDAWTASTHTNFQQATIASRYLGEQLQEILEQAEALLPRKSPPKIVLPASKPRSSPETSESGEAAAESAVVRNADSAPDVAGNHGNPTDPGATIAPDNRDIPRTQAGTTT